VKWWALKWPPLEPRFSDSYVIQWLIAVSVALRQLTASSSHVVIKQFCG